MAQFARPNADVSAGLWNVTPLNQKIDEVVRDDADLVSSNNNSNDTAGSTMIGLSTVTDPEVSTGHILRYTYRKDAAAGHGVGFTTTLRVGTTIVATFSHSIISETFVQADQTLTEAQANDITDYSNLRMELRRFGDTGGSPANRRSAQVSWAEFEVPDAPGGGSDLTSAGVATTSPVGASEFRGAASAAGAASVSAIGASLFEATLSSAGASAVSQVGAAEFRANAQSAGVASLSLEGAQGAAGDLSSAGLASITWDSRLLAESPFASVGAASTSLNTTVESRTLAQSVGTSAVDIDVGSLVASDLSSAGVASVNFIKGTQGSDFTSASIASLSLEIRSEFAVDAQSTGLATLAVVGATLVAAVLTSQGSAFFNGVGEAGSGSGQPDYFGTDGMSMRAKM